MFVAGLMHSLHLRFFSGGMLMPSWFDIHDAPITSVSVRDEEDVLRAVQSVHAMIDREIAAGTNPQDVFVFGLSQGGRTNIVIRRLIYVHLKKV